MAMLRVAASFWRLLIRYWRMGNLRAEGFGAAKCESNNDKSASMAYLQAFLESPWHRLSLGMHC